MSDEGTTMSDDEMDTGSEPESSPGATDTDADDNDADDTDTDDAGTDTDADDPS